MLKNKKILYKIISLLLIVGILTPFLHVETVHAAPETGIKNAMDDAISGELVALCNELGLDTVDFGSSWVGGTERNWLSGMAIAIKKLFKWFFHRVENDPLCHYNVKKTYASLFANKWPYDKQYHGDDDRMHPTIGDVCAALGIEQVKEFGQYDAAYGERKYDDVNFTEILAILAQGDKGNWRTVDYEVFNDYIRRPEAQNLYYECDIEWWVNFECDSCVDEKGRPKHCQLNKSYGHGKEGEGAAQAAPDEFDEPPHHWVKQYYWGEVTVKPMGLRNLYMLAEAVPSDINQDFYFHTNYDLLNHHEDYTHTYLREAAELNPVNYFDKRTKTSPIYEDLIAYYGKAMGRSAPFYIEKPYNLEDNPLAKIYTEMFQQYRAEEMQEWNIEWDGDVSEAQQKILALAQSAIGKISYQYGGRASGLGWDATFGSSTPDYKKRVNGLDCSGFVSWVYQSTVGFNPGYSCAAYKDKPTISRSELQPGMLGVKYGQANENTSGNHIGIYAGKDSSGQDLWIHCSGSSGVVINNYSGFTHFYNPLGG